MATRPLAFGVRLRDRDKGRSVRVLQDPRSPRRYLIEDRAQDGRTRRRAHASLASALRDLAVTWRERLH
ncbi:MAG: hypothetical protein OEM49_01340 [Myxococcales bacterium]|nr:hypothetical protein [Myxococcales bacterium]MDH5306538.1 hypothetical protein [Myxococcales bacterium]MDH5565558.1 hypothetical protein [Myxococcales bacterium]